MDSKKWDRVLVDWVNCLKLCKPIQKLDDLKDGIFFTNLQKLLRKTTEIDTDVLTCLFRVLGQHYPDFIIDNKANIHLTDLSSSDLSAITSLLLHYTCIHDRRDVLTSPLCYNLQQITQICIKNFLEKIQVCTKITNEELINIIQCCVDEIEKKPDMSCHLLAIANTPVNRKSPLQDFLRTPASKNVRLQEKERELNKLKTELELVQDEKESLEEDLKLQIEKNTRLEKQLHQKVTEISRLKSEVLVLENRTPPHYQDKDSRETQRILRTKIESLEQILEQCDREIKELIDERDSEKSQVKTLEAQCKVWLEKFIESDNKLQCLSEESKEREFKFVNLVSHCRELETLLEELKGEHKNDSFIEESFQCLGNLDVMTKNMEPLPPSEDLAHSVIDIQLKDVQKENEQLKSTLYEAENDSKGLKENIGRLLQDIELLKSEKIDLEDALKKRNDECEEMSVKHEKLEEQYIKLFEQNATVLKQKEKLSEKLEEFVKEHETIASELKDALQKIAVVCEQLETVQSVKEEVSNKLDSKVKELEVALFEKQDIFNKLQEMTNENDKNCKSFETEKLKNKNIVEDLNKVSEKLKTTIKEKTKIISELEKEKFEKKRLAESLEEALRDLNNAISTKNEIIQMKSVILEQLDGFNTKLIKANDQICTITDKLQSLTLERNGLQEELDKVVEEKQEVCDNLDDLSKKLERVATEKHEILEKFQKKSEELKEALSETNILNETLKKVNEEKSHLFEQLGDIQSVHSETKHKLETISKNLREVLLEKENLLDNNKVLTSNLESVRSEKEVLSNRLNDVLTENSNISKKLGIANDEKQKLFENIQIITSEKINIAQGLETLRQKLGEIIADKGQIFEISGEKQDFQQNIEIITLMLETVTSQLESAISEKKNFAEKNLDMSQKLKILEEKLKESDKEKTHFYEQLISVTSEKSDLTSKLDETVKERCQIIEDFKELRYKVEDLSDELEMIKSERDLLSGKLKIVTEEKDTTNKELEKIKTEKDKTVENLSQLSKAKEQELQVFVIKNNDLLKKLEAAALKNEKLTEKIEQLLQEKTRTSTELQIITSEKQEILDKLANAIKDKNEMLNKVEEALNEKNHINEQLQNVLREKDELEKLIEKNKEISEELLQEKQVISKFLDLNTSQLRKVSQEKDDILDALEMSNKEVQKIVQEKNDVIEQMSQEKIHLLEQLTKRSEEKIELAESLQLSKKELEAVLKEKDDFSKQISSITKNCKTLQTSLEEAQSKFEKICQEKDNISEQYERICKEKAEFSVQLDKASQENVDIKEKLLKISQEKVQLVNSLQAVKNVLGKMSEGTDFEDVEKIIKEKLLAMQSLETRNKELLVELQDKSKTIEKLEEQLKEKTNICCLPEHKDILEAIKKLSREKIELAESLHLITKELEKLSQEKHNLAETFEKTCVELQKVKQSRNEILESQTKIMKETENNILLAHENAVEVKNDLIKRIELAEKEKQNLKKSLESDLQVIRQAYANVVSTNSKYELENVNLRKKIEDKNKQLTEFAQIKEAYEKLLEENNKLMTEVDTVKYKRARDREDFVNLLKKERMEADARESKKVREVRNDYEAKLEKMKEKMLKLYREEINKEMAKVKAEQNETTYYQKTISELKSNLFEAEQKIHLLETEREMIHIKESKREMERNGLSIVSHTADFKNTRTQDSNQLTRRAKSSTTLQVAGQKGERKMATLPRANITEVEETITISRRTSINGVPSSIGHNIEMEDEDDDLFNNKYLADLKDGRCTLPLTGRESNVSRFSELAWRNSLVPPHLKSSYPAETQFLSPTHFKEDDIKTGNVEGDDSMCRLLPGEKPRQRKDFGTTSYKKPGPPTPSKNGGRLSLQGNEIQPLREHNDKTPKKVTPSRIKALFMGRPSSNSLRENSENQCATPRTKRLSIFRKQR